MKILITGSNGLLGQKIVYRLKELSGYSIIACARGENRIKDQSGYIYEPVDLTNADDVKRIFSRHHPDCVIHTAAMTDVDACEINPEICHLQNVGVVEMLTSACEKSNTHFIHLSTDFVFDGKNGPYKEDDPIGPISVYARSKAEAESVVMKIEAPWTIVRTMIIYGITDDKQRSNVVLWTKKSLEEGKAIRVISDQFRGPTLAEDLADACIAAAQKKATGIFHVSGREVMSILEISYKVADYFHLDKTLIQPITTKELGQAALRPLKTGFIISKAERELGYQPHSLEQGLAIIDRQLRNKY